MKLYLVGSDAQSESDSPEIWSAAVPSTDSVQTTSPPPNTIKPAPPRGDALVVVRGGKQETGGGGEAA